MKLRNDNKGFSLVEALVVIALLALLVTVTSFSLGLPAATQAKKTTLGIDALIGRTKTGTLAKTGDVFLIISTDSDGCIGAAYYEDGIKKEWDTFSEPEKVKLYYVLNNGADSAKVELEEDECIVLGFDRRTNGFVYLDESTLRATGNTLSASDASGAIGGPDDFTTKLIVVGGQVEYYIELGRVTGSTFKSVN